MSDALGSADQLELPAESILGILPGDLPRGIPLGHSREGRAILGYRMGRGPHAISLIAGCHADEPVGPALLERLVRYLGSLPEQHPLLNHLSWYLVPHVNPDGEIRNLPWTAPEGQPVIPPQDSLLGSEDAPRPFGYDPGLYLQHVRREPPGEDVEFGFPRDSDDHQVRPENRAVATFLAEGAPFTLHASLHGMAYAAGPWYLIEQAWIERSSEMRDRVRATVRALGYTLHDVDRGGEKGFHRIDEGFTTRPDSRAMAEHFLDLGDHETADLFRPSSMETVRALGGDPLTLVTEMPLFLLGNEHFSAGRLVHPETVQQLRLAAEKGAEATRSMAREVGFRAMPVVHQMTLQLSYLEEALRCAVRAKV